MVEQVFASHTPSPHTTEDKLFMSNLDACIEGIENFPVTKRRSLIGSHFPVRSFVKQAVTSPAPVDLPGPLPSPPLSPPQHLRSPPSHTLAPLSVAMNRSLLHGGPTRSNVGPSRGHQDTRPSQDARSPQDARNNLAVQPAANAGTFKLKKNAVKIVSATGSTPSAPLSNAHFQPAVSNSSLAATSLPIPVSSPSAGLVKTQKAVNKDNEPQQLPGLAAKPASPTSVCMLPPSKIDLPPQTLVASYALDDMFARLSATPLSVPSRPAKEFSPVGPDKSFFSFEGRPDTIMAITKLAGSAPSKNQTPLRPATSQLNTGFLPDELPYLQSPFKIQQAPSAASWQGESQDKREREYLRKAADYFSKLPYRPGDSAHIIKTVADKLHVAHVSDPTKLRPEDAEKLRARYAFAVVSYINKKVKLNSESLTADFVKQVLRDSNGDFLQLCAALVKDKFIALDNLEEVTQLCQNILNVLPKADDSLKTTQSELSKLNAITKPAASMTSATHALNKMPDDSLEGIRAWPAREKREHGAIYRACVLKGVGGIMSLNELQALVWGGRLESISMPEPGSEHALVKFLKPEACQAYLDATENGIEVQGGTKKTIVFVNKQPGPNSINDVIQNCIEGDASRCVRATGADDDWSDGALFKLARGKQQIPRDVDRIKQGKTAQRHHYIEFRFGNIYHALNFRRYLMDDEEWEHCSISYAPDPCELARGMHYKDADEVDGGYFG